MRSECKPTMYQSYKKPTHSRIYFYNKVDLLSLFNQVG